MKVILKDDVNPDELLSMNPLLWQMFSYVVGFCAEHNIKMVVSSIYRPPNDGISVSTTHQDYRAFDVSLKKEHGWTDGKISLIENEINHTFLHIGAVSYNTGKSRPIVVHDTGSGMHLHFQVRRL